MTQSTQSGFGRVFITGGAGFIGANLVRVLLDRGCHVTVLDNLATGHLEYLEGLPINFLHGDILDTEALDRALAGQDGVVHLAAQTSVAESVRDPRRDCEVNILGMLNLLESCRREMERRAKGQQGKVGNLPGPRVVFASSNAPLGRQAPPATEEKAPLPMSPYGASKLAGEGYNLAYHGSWGLQTLVLRFGNVYGPFSAHKNSVVAKFFKDLIAMGYLVLDGDGEQTRDFIYVGDLSEAIVRALETNISGEVVQIATGVETTIRSVASLVQRTAKQDVGIRHGPSRRGDIHRNFSSILKAKSLLNWEPHVDLSEGLRRTWQWFQRQGVGRSKLTASSAGSPLNSIPSD